MCILAKETCDKNKEEFKKWKLNRSTQIQSKGKRKEIMNDKK
jgi:hypothetical protein